MKIIYKDVIIEVSNPAEAVEIIKTLKNPNSTKTIIKTKVVWTEEEDRILLQNIHKKPEEIMKLEELQRHTPKAIYSHLSAVKLKKYDRVSPLTRKVIEQYGN